MNIKSYVNYNPSCLPGNYEAIKAMSIEKEEIKELLKFDKIINAIWEIDESADVCLIADLFHASYNIGDRWFVIDENPDNTYTLQENIENGDIVYIVDGCMYQKVLAKKVLQYLRNL